MKKNILTFALLILTISVFAQRKETVVFLKSGSIMHGKILEQVPNEFVKIENNCGDILVYKAIEYDSIYSASDLAYKHFKNKQIDKLYFTFSPMIHVNNNDDPFLTFEFSAGRRFLGNFSAGIGTGLLIVEQMLYPVFADARLYAFKTANSPFFEIKLGRAFSDKTDFDENFIAYKGGLLFGLETGLATRLGKDGLFEFKIGYRFQRFTEVQKNNWWNDYTTETEYNLNRLSFGLGFTFF